MFFKNLSMFRFSVSTAHAMAEPSTLPMIGGNLPAGIPLAIDVGLDEHQLRECGALELATRGFVSPFGRDSDELILRQPDVDLIAVGGNDKLLPSSVVNEELAKKLDHIHTTEQRRVGAKERKRLKDEVITDLLPRAFVKQSRTFAYLDYVRGWIIIDTASRKVAEDVVVQVREAVGRFPATPLAPEESPRALLTAWLTTGDLPPGLVLGDQVELRDPAEAGAIVRCRRQDLELDEIKEHLKSGKQVFQLGLEYDERMSFVLGEDLVIRKLHFLDVVTDEIDESSMESARAELTATFTLMSLELRRLQGKLEEWFAIQRPTDQA